MFVPILSAAWVVVCAGYNFLEPRIPNWIMNIGFLGAVLFRIIDWQGSGVDGFQVMWILFTWTNALAFWSFEWWGGGDAKFLMIIILAFPDTAMVMWMMAVNLALTLVILIKKADWKVSNWLPGVKKPQKLADSDDRLRAVTIMGLGWFIWFAIELF